MTGSPLYDATVADIRARTTDPFTSHAAAATTDVVKSQAFVLSLLWHYGDSTDADLFRHMEFERINTQGRSPRFRESRLRTARCELVRLGEVEYAGYTALTTSGRSAQVWRLTKEGIEVAA